MTSEAPHRPGQEPGEVSPGAGGTAPYGDRPAQQDNGYPGAPDLGWAPPPPAGRPGQSAPAWATQDDQAAWAQPGGQSPNPTWGSAQVPQQPEPGGWGGSPQPGWAQEQGGPAWATGSAPSTPPGEPAPPAWATAPEQTGPAWATAPAPAAPQGEQPAWAQPGEPTPRGAAQVPGSTGQPHDAWSTPAGQAQDDAARSGGWPTPVPQDDPNRSGGWPTPVPQDDAAHSGGWPTPVPQDDPGRSGGWAAQQQDDSARSGGWATPQQDDQPAWAPQGEQSAPAWAPAEPTARAAAQVPVPGAQPDPGWSTPDDPARSGGWAVGTPGRQDEAEPAHGWTPPQQDDPARSGGWQTGAASHDEDPDRSGGWAAGRAAGRAEAPQPSAWGTPDDQRQATGWSAAVPQQHDRPGQDRPAVDEPAQPGAWDAAAAPAAEASPARASASVPSPDGPPAWGASQDDPAQWTAGERPVVPDAEPWTAAEAWGRAAEAESAQSPSNGWEPVRAEESSAYQPAPGPGISPTNAVPLPPQEQRVPGASLAAAPPADYVPPAQFAPQAEAHAEPGGRDQQSYESEQSGAVAGWGPAEQAHEEPQPSAGPVVPAPRTSPESGGVSASASVPLASRVMPPTDQALRPAGAPAPQPRVYGRPARPEPEDAPEQGGPNGHPESGSRFDEHGPQPRFDEQGPTGGFDDQGRPSGPHGFAEAPSGPSSPAGPPPFPTGVPSFVDPVGNNRPVNGVHPHSGERPGDPFGGTGAPGGHHDPFGAQAGPGNHDAFGAQAGPGHGPFGGQGGPGDPFGGPAGGRASVAVPGHGPGAMNEQGPSGFPPAFPPPPQAAPPSWQQNVGGDPDQGRFDAFKQEAEAKTEAPTPKVRNGKVLGLVLIAAVLILAIPLGLLTLLGKVGGGDEPAAFDPAVGSCVKQSGGGAVAADCGEQDAFTVVSKVDAKDKCADPGQPHVVLPGDGPNRVLCLKPAAAK